MSDNISPFSSQLLPVCAISLVSSCLIWHSLAVYSRVGFYVRVHKIGSCQACLCYGTGMSVLWEDPVSPVRTSVPALIWPPGFVEHRCVSGVCLAVVGTDFTTCLRCGLKGKGFIFSVHWHWNPCLAQSRGWVSLGRHDPTGILSFSPSWQRLLSRLVSDLKNFQANLPSQLLFCGQFQWWRLWNKAY